MKLTDLVCPARSFVAFAIVLLPLAGSRVLAQQPADSPSPTARLPLAFVENRGQWDTPARFVVRRGPLTGHFAPDGWTLDMVASRKDGKGEGCAVRLVFDGAEKDVTPVGERPLPGHYSFFRGNDPAAWQSGVRSYSSILYRGMYPGVDVRVRSNRQDIEYDLLLEPGADLDRVVVRCSGTLGLEVDKGGALVLETGLGPIRQEPPKTWEVTADGERRLVACRYRRIDDSRYGFSVPERDDRSVLVIDPGLVWSTYLGGSGVDLGLRVIADPSGDFILVGATASVNFPTTPGAYQTTLKGPFNAHISRISAAGKLVWATLLGGSGSRGGVAWGIVREKSGDLVVVGSTSSRDFPTTSGAYDTTHNGPGLGDAFVSRLSGDGKSLLYSTYLGGTLDEWARSVGLDAAGNVFVAGGTDSKDFPTTAGAYDTTYNLDGDVWVASLRLGGNGAKDLLWSTFLGGSGRDGGRLDPTSVQRMKHVDLAVEPSGIATVAGGTWSSNFPTTAGAFQRIHGGGRDFFVTRLAAGGGALQASTFVGGAGTEGQPPLALNRRGEPIVGGLTRSANFPTSAGAFSTTRNGMQDACLFRLDRAFSKLVYSTFIGGPAANTWDVFDEIHVDSAGTVTAVGRADDGFPTTPGAYDRTFNPPPADTPVVRMRTDNNGVRDLHYASYLGGSGIEAAYGVVWDGISTATVVGHTSSRDFPTKNAHQRSHAGAKHDVFITRICLLPTGVRVFGKSSPGCNGPVSTGVTEMPAVNGKNFALTCSGAPTNGGGVFLLGLGDSKPPFKVFGIEIWLDLTKLLALLPSASDDLGYAEFPIPIPNDPGLRGGRLFGQFVWASRCGPQGLSASSGIDFTIQ